MPTVTATRILKGQLEGNLGPETPLAMDSFPYMTLSKVSTEPHIWDEGEEIGNGWRRRNLEELGPKLATRTVWTWPRKIGLMSTSSTQLRMSLSPDIQRGQTGFRQCGYSYRLSVRGQGQLHDHWSERSSPS